MTVRIEGLRELKANLAKLSREVRREVVQQATKDAAEELRRDISNHINHDTAAGRPRSGKASDFASAPGQYPKTDKGGLVRGLTTRKHSKGAAVVSSVSYAVPVEFKDAAKGGRPYMGRGLQENENKIRRRVVEALKGILRRPRA